MRAIKGDLEISNASPVLSLSFLYVKSELIAVCVMLEIRH